MAFLFRRLTFRSWCQQGDELAPQYGIYGNDERRMVESDWIVDQGNPFWFRSLAGVGGDIGNE